MTIKFKYGFEYKNFLFGWNKKDLYRLPSNSNNRFYPLRKLNVVKINNNKGYRVVRDQKTIKQLEFLTERIDYIYTINGKGSEDCPF